MAVNQPLRNPLGETQLRIVEPSNPVDSATDPVYGYSFSYAIYGETRQKGDWERRFVVRAQKRDRMPLVRRASTFLLRCCDYAIDRLNRDFVIAGSRELNVYFCNEGRPGGEHFRNNIYLFRADDSVAPIDWAREIAHEFGHAAVPPINSFTEPEAWANGDVGERLFLEWLLEDLKSGRLSPDDAMRCAPGDLERYLDRHKKPLVDRLLANGLDVRKYRSRSAEGYFEYVAFACYLERVYGAALLARSMALAGGVEPEHFLKGATEAINESDDLTVTMRKQSQMLFLPNYAQWRTEQGRLERGSSSDWPRIALQNWKPDQKLRLTKA